MLNSQHSNHTDRSGVNPGRLHSVRFSMRSLLALVFGCSLALYGWRAFIYQPPWYEFPLYERAPRARGLAMQVGPNELSISQVVRNQRAKQLLVEDGAGKPLAGATVTSPGPLKSSAPWLDVVQIELQSDPQLVELASLRVFDHATRMLLSDKDRRLGWRIVAPNLLQLYGVGRMLPDEVDVWLRLTSYAAGEPIQRLEPAIGATCQLENYRFTVKELQRGLWAFDSRKEPKLHWLQQKNSLNQTSVVLTWEADGGAPPARHQVVAVAKDGQRDLGNREVLLLDSRHSMVRSAYFSCYVPLEDIDYFELRPDGGSDRFFFERVQLPRVSSTVFEAPPSVVVPIGGKQIRTTVEEYRPLHVELDTREGQPIRGTSSNGRGTWFLVGEETEADQGNSFTLIQRVSGLGGLEWRIRYQLQGNAQYVSGDALKSRGGGSHHGGNSFGGYTTFLTPLQDLESLQFQLWPGP